MAARVRVRCNCVRILLASNFSHRRFIVRTTAMHAVAIWKFLVTAVCVYASGLDAVTAVGRVRMFISQGESAGKGGGTCDTYSGPENFHENSLQGK